MLRSSQRATGWSSTSQALSARRIPIPAVQHGGLRREAVARRSNSPVGGFRRPTGGYVRGCRLGSGGEIFSQYS